MAVNLTEVQLESFVRSITVRGECNCGRCVDRGDRPDPTGHTVDVGFFKVALRLPYLADMESLKQHFIKLSREWPGKFSQCDPFDGMDHTFIELGSWLGDQAFALRWMGAGELLGVLDVLTPRRVFGDALTDEQVTMMVASGYVTARAKLEVINAGS